MPPRDVSGVTLRTLNVCSVTPLTPPAGLYRGAVPTVRFTLDDAARHALTALRAQVAAAGIPVPDDEPAVTVAAATAVPQAARDALAAELRLLAIPSVWLATLGTVAGRPDELVLAAVVDAELLAVHAAVHDALAGRVRGPVAAYLPGT